MNNGGHVIPLNHTTSVAKLSVSSVADLLTDEQELLKRELSGLFNGDTGDFDTARALTIIDNLLKRFYEDKDRYRTNSWKALDYLWNTFVNWCQNKNYTPIPASAFVVEQFFATEENKYKANTLALFLWAISTIHRAAGVPNPTDTELAKHRLKSIRKRKVEKAEFTEQVSAFRENHLELLIGDWRNSNKSILRRDLALLCTSYETLLRESELTRIKFEHITINSKGCAVITIPVTKTNHSGNPDVVTVSPQCTHIISEYLECVGLDFEGSNYLFKRLHANGSLLNESFLNGLKPVKPITGKTVDYIFGKAWDHLTTTYQGLMRNVPKWSGHSARVGACQDLLQSGYNPLQVQQAGRWSSIEMVYRYGRDILSEESAMFRARGHKQ